MYVRQNMIVFMCVSARFGSLQYTGVFTSSNYPPPESEDEIHQDLCRRRVCLNYGQNLPYRCSDHGQNLVVVWMVSFFYNLVDFFVSILANSWATKSLAKILASRVFGKQPWTRIEHTRNDWATAMERIFTTYSKWLSYRYGGGSSCCARVSVWGTNKLKEPLIFQKLAQYIYTS
jgi:hypothetical protein